jgi:hypothetical protein
LEFVSVNEQWGIKQVTVLGMVPMSMGYYHKINIRWREPALGKLVDQELAPTNVP